jgi:hypothetical protein
MVSCEYTATPSTWSGTGQGKGAPCRRIPPLRCGQTLAPAPTHKGLAAARKRTRTVGIAWAMIKSVSAVTGVLVTTLLLTACSTAAHGESHTWAAGCARAEADVRGAALQIGPYVGVTTPRDVIAANKRLLALGPEITAARKTLERVTFSGPRTSVEVVPFPRALARKMRQIFADMSAFEVASRPQAKGDAAQKLMQDIPAVHATCSQKH